MQTLGDILDAALKANENEALEANANPDNRHFYSIATSHIWANLPKYPNRKIEMIKILRRVTGLGLKDAKDVVEHRDGFVLPTAMVDLIFSDDKYSFVRSNPYYIDLKPYRVFC